MPRLEEYVIILDDMNGEDEQHGHSHPLTMATNLRQPMAFWRKVALIIFNNLLKIKARQRCCRNLGQPGC